MIKRSFFTGFLLLLPLIVTLAIVNIVLNFLTKPFVGIFQQIVIHYGLFNTSFANFVESTLFLWLTKFFILALLACIILLTGTLGNFLLIHKLLSKSDRLFRAIPLFGKLYASVRDVIHMLFSQESKSFSEAVLVPYPHSSARSIGFIANGGSSSTDADGKVLVYIPTAPNPTTGYLLYFSRSEMTQLKITVDEAMKFVISCGTALQERNPP